jgi:hypothetical protein
MLLTMVRSPIGATAPASTRTRRSTADAGKIPATLLPCRGRRDASSLGPRPAHSRPAVPTREHQSGGPPIHAAPTRSWPTSARPPPGPPALTGEHQELLTGGSHLTAPFHIKGQARRPRLPQLRQLPATAAVALRRQVADSPDRKTARPLSTLGGVEPDNQSSEKPAQPRVAKPRIVPPVPQPSRHRTRTLRHDRSSQLP